MQLCPCHVYHRAQRHCFSWMRHPLNLCVSYTPVRTAPPRPSRMCVNSVICIPRVICMPRVICTARVICMPQMVAYREWHSARRVRHAIRAARHPLVGLCVSLRLGFALRCDGSSPSHCSIITMYGIKSNEKIHGRHPLAAPNVHPGGPSRIAHTLHAAYRRARPGGPSAG
jgi:hypothetical protein